MTIGTTSIAPGWYKDPAGSPALRWWDGNQWTDHLQQSAAAAPPAVVTPTVAAPVEPLPRVAPFVQYVQSGTGQPGMPQPGTIQPGAVQPATIRPGFLTDPDYDTSRRGQWSNIPSGYGLPAPRATPPTTRNALGWVGFALGILTVTALGISIPTDNSPVAVIGGVLSIIAIVMCSVAIHRFRHRGATLVWAPIVGLVFSVLAELGIILLLVLAIIVAGHEGLLGGAGNDTAIGAPATSTVNYSMGVGSLQFVPNANAGLSLAAQQESTLVGALQRDYPSGKWPSELHGDANGHVIASDGRDVGTFLESDWVINYRVASNGSYVLEISPMPADEVAVYYSGTQQYWAWCDLSDTSCKTSSPVPPSYSVTPSIAPTSSSLGTSSARARFE